MTCPVEWVDAEDPVFLLYTSGSTGKPKGVLHTSGGYMVYTATTFKYAFDYKDSDIYWCTADCGWIKGHSYVTYGPLLNGAICLVKLASAGNFSFSERLVAKYAGAAAMYFVSKKLKKKYNITDERAALYEAANTWVNALNGREFLGGTKANLADLAVYGVLRPIRYLKSGKDMVEHTQIGEWYARMESAVGQSCGIKS